MQVSVTDVSTAPADITAPATRTPTVPALTGIRFFAALYVFIVSVRLWPHGKRPESG